VVEGVGSMVIELLVLVIVGEGPVTECYIRELSVCSSPDNWENPIVGLSLCN
jgi:hypothetical protein